MKTILCFALILFCVNPSYSQVDKGYKDAIYELLQASGSEEAFKVITIKMCDELFQVGEVPEKFKGDFKEEILKTSLSDLVELIAPTYYKYLTLKDIQKISEFYKSPVGKKYSKAMPSIQTESMEVGKIWGIQMGQKIQDKIKALGY